MNKTKYNGRQLDEDELAIASIFRDAKIAEQQAFRKREKSKLIFWLLIIIFTALYSIEICLIMGCPV